MKFEGNNQKDVNFLKVITDQQCDQYTLIKLGNRRVPNDISKINAISRFKNLTEVIMFNIQATNVECLKHCSKLKQITTEFCENIASFDFIHLLPSLEELTLINTAITTLNISPSNDKLKLLNLNSCRQLLQLTGLENCRQLQSLDIKYTAIQELDVPVSLKNLKILKIGNETKLQINGIDNLLSVEKLDVCESIVKCLEIPPQMKNLKKLNAWSCEQLCQIKGLENCLQLMILNISYTQITAFQIHPTWNNLRKLSANHCNCLRQITGLENCPQLQKLDIKLSAIEELTIPDNLKGLKILGIGNEQMPRLNGLRNLEFLEHLDVSYTNLTYLNIPVEMNNLEVIEAGYCGSLIQITGLENCHELQELTIFDTEIEHYDVDVGFAKNHFFISVPEIQLVIFNTEYELINFDKLMDNDTTVEQLLLLQQDCDEIVEEFQEDYTLMDFILDELTPHQLILTNCINIDAISDYINKFEELTIKFNKIEDLYFIPQYCQVKRLSIENCMLLTDCSNISQCEYLENLILRGLVIKDLNFIVQCSKLQSICVEACQQLVDIRETASCSELNNIQLMNTKVQDFSPLIGLNSIKQVKIFNNYRQEQDFILNIHKSMNNSLAQLKRQLFFKQISQTCYYVSRQTIKFAKIIKLHQQRNKQKINNINRLCVDIINKIVQHQEGFQ